MCNGAAAMSARPVVVVASPDRTEAALLCDWLRAEGLEPVPALSLQTAKHDVQSRAYDVLIADAAFAFDGDLQAAARAHNARAPLVVVGGDAATRARWTRRCCCATSRWRSPRDGRRGGLPASASLRSNRSSKGRPPTSSMSATRVCGSLFRADDSRRLRNSRSASR